MFGILQIASFIMNIFAVRVHTFFQSRCTKRKSRAVENNQFEMNRVGTINEEDEENGEWDDQYDGQSNMGYETNGNFKNSVSGGGPRRLSKNVSRNTSRVSTGNRMSRQMSNNRNLSQLRDILRGKVIKCFFLN